MKQMSKLNQLHTSELCSDLEGLSSIQLTLLEIHLHDLRPILACMEMGRQDMGSCEGMNSI